MAATRISVRFLLIQIAVLTTDIYQSRAASLKLCIHPTTSGVMMMLDVVLFVNFTNLAYLRFRIFFKDLDGRRLRQRRSYAVQTYSIFLQY